MEQQFKESEKTSAPPSGYFRVSFNRRYRLVPSYLFQSRFRWKSDSFSKCTSANVMVASYRFDIYLLVNIVLIYNQWGAVAAGSYKYYYEGIVDTRTEKIPKGYYMGCVSQDNRSDKPTGTIQYMKTTTNTVQCSVSGSLVTKLTLMWALERYLAGNRILPALQA